MGSRVDVPVARQWRRNLARDYPGLPSGALLVGVLLADYADWRDGTGARPSQDTLAEECGMSARQVRAHLSQLEKVGAIRCVGRAFRVKVYDLHVTGSPLPHTSKGNRKPTSADAETKPEAQRHVTGSPASRNRKPTSDNHQITKDHHHHAPEDTMTAADGLADHGGGGVDDLLHTLNSGLPAGLRMAPTAKALDSITSALASGWDSDQITARALANLDGIKSPGAIVNRLATLARTSPPAPSSGAGRPWHEDPQLLRRVAGRLLVEAPHLGRVLDRLAADDFDVSVVEIVGDNAVAIVATHPTIPNHESWSVGWTVQSDGRTSCHARMDVGAEEVAEMPQHGFELAADGYGVCSKSSVPAFDALTRATFTVAARHYGEQLQVVA